MKIKCIFGKDCPEKSQVLFVFSFLTSVVFFLFGSIYLIKGNYPLGVVEVTFGLLSAIIFYQTYKEFDPKKLSKKLLIYIYIMSIIIFITGGIGDTGYLWILLIPMFSVTLIKERESIKWVMVYGLIILSLILINCNVYEILEYDCVLLRQTFLVFVLFIILGYHTEKTRRKARKIIKQTNSELEALNNNLENRVKEEVEKNLIKEKQLIEQSKMAAMGEMIGNIAHQWRQPLTVISSSSTGVLIYKEMGKLNNEMIEKEMNQINDNAQYLSQTIDDFRSFLKGDKKIIEFDLNEDIKSFLTLLEGSIKSNEINVIKGLEDDVSLLGYPNQLIQCMINIFNNSKDALKDCKEDKFIFISTQKVDDKVSISIKDNAGGIPDEVLPRIFEPYFTTKEESGGTGLGLSMTYSIIVNGMGGNIEAKNITYYYNNEEYVGAEFLITLQNI